jgi:hypothetical protein
VNAYVIAITCEGYNAQMILKIDDSSGTPRINELLVRPIEGSSLSGLEVPDVDLDLLLRSLPAPAPGAGRPTRPEHDLADRPAASRSEQPAAEADRPAAAPAKKGGTVTKQSNGSTDRRRRIRTTTVSGARAYRRMPDDLAATYAKSGSITAVARHYGVPRHTAQGWIGRLRRQDDRVG